MKTQEQVEMQATLISALKAGRIRKVWVVENTRGTVGISETTATWKIVDFDRCKTNRDAVTFCFGEQDCYGSEYFAYPAFAPLETDYPQTRGGEGDTIPAADSADELLSLFSDGHISS